MEWFLKSNTLAGILLFVHVSCTPHKYSSLKQIVRSAMPSGVKWKAHDSIMWSSVCTSLLWPPHSCCRWPVVVDLTTLGVLVCAPAIVHNPIFSLFLSVPCARTHCFMVPRPPFLHNIYSSPEFPVSNFYSLHAQQTRRVGSPKSERSQLGDI